MERALPAPTRPPVGGRHSQLFRFKIAWGLGNSLPWLISTLVIIGVAQLEEIRMRREQGECSAVHAPGSSR